jgi:hypothetical protein
MDLFKKAKETASKEEPGRKKVAKAKPVTNAPILNEDGLSKRALKKKKAYEYAKEQERLRAEWNKREAEARAREIRMHKERIERLLSSDMAIKNPRMEISTREDIDYLLGEGNLPALLSKLQSLSDKGYMETELDSYNDSYGAESCTTYICDTRMETDEEWGERLIEYENMRLEAEREKQIKEAEKARKVMEAATKKAEKIKNLEAELKKLKSEK